MFLLGTYYKFGKNVFKISLIKRLPLFILGIAIVVSLHIFLNGAVVNFALYGTLFLIIYAFVIVIDAIYQYISRQFMLDEFSIRIRTGVFNRQEIAIPYRQIQDVTLKESYIERLFGLVELSVFTAGHEDADPKTNESSGAFFPLIDHSYAIELQQELLRRSNVQEVIHHGEDNIDNPELKKI